MQNRWYSIFPSSPLPVTLPIWLVSDATLGAPSEGSGELTCDCPSIVVAPTPSRAKEPSANVTANFLRVIAGLSLKSRNQFRKRCYCSTLLPWDYRSRRRRRRLAAPVRLFLRGRIPNQAPHPPG